MENFRDSELWIKATELTRDIFYLSNMFGDDTLSDILRNSCMDLLAEIMQHFVWHDISKEELNANGILNRIETQILIAKGQHYLSSDEIRNFSKTIDELRSFCPKMTEHFF